MSFGPKKRELKEILITSLGALISGIVGSLLLFLITVAFSGFINIWDGFRAASNGLANTNIVFPLVLSIFAFLAISFTSFVTYFFLNFANPERYKKNIIILGQIAFFTFLAYLFFAPSYIYAGLIDYNYIIIVFLIHVILVIFGVNLIIEILNNYRYILVSVYGAFVGLFFSIIIISSLFFSLESMTAKLISLLFILPLASFLQVFFKGFFDFSYFHYNRLTNYDQVGDIFYQIELEEKQALKEEEEKNLI